MITVNTKVELTEMELDSCSGVGGGISNFFRYSRSHSKGKMRSSCSLRVNSFVVGLSAGADLGAAVEAHR